MTEDTSDYAAVTFDTQTVCSNSFDFDGGLLGQLKTLRHDRVQVVVSDVVIREITKHLSEHNYSVISSLTTAVKKAQYLEIADVSLPMLGREHARVLARDRLAKYLGRLNAEILGYEKVSTTELMSRYFGRKPPFSVEKKSEFPDAIALLSLDAWAGERNVRILAISGDRDWQHFGETSVYIDVVADVATAMDLLNQQSDGARKIVGEALEAISELTNRRLFNELNEGIQSALDYLTFEGEALSRYVIDSEEIEVNLIHANLSGLPSFELISHNEETGEFVVSIDANLTLEAEARFHLSVDTEDGYYSLGSTSADITEEVDAKLMVTIVQAEDNFRIHDVRITKIPKFLKFGEIDLDDSPDDADEASALDLYLDALKMSQVKDDGVP